MGWKDDIPVSSDEQPAPAGSTTAPGWQQNPTVGPAQGDPAAQYQQQSFLTRFADPYMEAARGATLGGGNWLAAAAAHPFDAQARAQLKQSFDENQQAYEAAHPYMSRLWSGAGAAAPAAAATILTGGEAAPLGVNMMRQAGAGALYGAGENAVQGVTDPYQAAKNIVTGAAGGVAAAPAARAGQIAQDLQPARAVQTGQSPSFQQLRSTADAQYKAADASGLQYAPRSFGKLVSDMEGAVDAPHLMSSQHAGTIDVLRNFQSYAQSGQPVTAEQIGRLRQNLNTVLGSTAQDAGADKFQTGKLKDLFNNFVENAGPSDVMQGDPAQVAQIWRDANANWAASERSQPISSIVRQAGVKATARDKLPEQEIRNRTADIIAKEDKAKQYTPEEQAAITNVYDPGFGRSVVQKVGSYAPTDFKHVAPYLLGAMVGGEGLGAEHALWAVPAAAATMGAKGLSSKLTKNAADVADALVRQRSPLAATMPSALPSIANSQLPLMASPGMNQVWGALAQPVPGAFVGQPPQGQPQ